MMGRGPASLETCWTTEMTSPPPPTRTPPTLAGGRMAEVCACVFVFVCEYVCRYIHVYEVLCVCVCVVCLYVCMRERGYVANLSYSANRCTCISSTLLSCFVCVGVHQLEAPTYLFIQMQLCRKESLKDWLAKTIHNRPLEIVSQYFQQVHVACVLTRAFTVDDSVVFLCMMSFL